MAQWLTIKLYYSAHQDSGLATIVILLLVVALDVITYKIY